MMKSISRLFHMPSLLNFRITLGCCMMPIQPRMTSMI